MDGKKKAAIIVLPFLILGIIILGCTGYNDAVNSSFGLFDTVINKSGTKGFVTAYHWSGDPKDNVIDIPDTDNNGVKLESLGGFTGTGVPNPFEIIGPDCTVEYVSDNPDDYEVPVSFEDMIFELKLGANIKSIATFLYSPNAVEHYRHIGVMQEDGSVIFYRILVNGECSPQSTYYYAKEGILYGAQSNEMVSNLPFANNADEINNTEEGE